MENISASGVNDMVGRFYRSALSVPLQEFRENLLREVAGLVPFDAAVWGTGEVSAEHFHSVTVMGLSVRFARHIEKTRQANPMFHYLMQHPDNPVAMAELISDDEFYVSDFYKKVCRPYKIERILGSSFRDPRNRVYNLVILFRFDQKYRFTTAERQIQKHLIFHMINALSLAYSVYLSQVSSEQGGSSAAICDRHGICYDTQPSFLSLIGEKFPDWQGGRLPFALPLDSPAVETPVQDLLISATPVGDLLCVRAREEGPMDMLTKREREIVNSVCRGLSYKEVARPLGIAPSTVSNHVYRVFEKLGVTSRTELAKLFNQSRHLH